MPLKELSPNSKLKNSFPGSCPYQAEIFTLLLPASATKFYLRYFIRILPGAGVDVKFRKDLDWYQGAVQPVFEILW